MKTYFSFLKQHTVKVGHLHEQNERYTELIDQQQNGPRDGLEIVPSNKIEYETINWPSLGDYLDVLYTKPAVS